MAGWAEANRLSWEGDVLGKRASQSNLFSADAQHLEFVGEESCYGFLARHGRELFGEEDFACRYCEDNGRRSLGSGR